MDELFPHCFSHPETPFVLQDGLWVILAGNPDPATSDSICCDPMIPHPVSLVPETLHPANHDLVDLDPASLNTKTL